VHLLGQSKANSKEHIDAIMLRSGKQLEEPQGPQGDADEGLAKEKGKEILGEKDDLVPESGEQDKHEETTKLRSVEPY